MGNSSEPQLFQSSILKEEISNAAAAGSVVVISAGNQKDDTCYHPPANITDSDAPGCIVVSSFDKEGNPAYSSNFGDSVDIGAPGVGVVSAANTSDQEYKQISGTSFAAPCIAAAAAMQLLLKPGMKPADVENYFEKSCVKSIRASVSENYGAGILKVKVTVN